MLCQVRPANLPTSKESAVANTLQLRVSFSLNKISRSIKLDNDTEVLAFKTTLKSNEKEPSIVTSGRVLILASVRMNLSVRF